MRDYRWTPRCASAAARLLDFDDSAPNVLGMPQQNIFEQEYYRSGDTRPGHIHMNPPFQARQIAIAAIRTYHIPSLDVAVGMKIAGESAQKRITSATPAIRAPS